MTTEESAKIGSKNSSAILAPIGSLAIAIAPTPSGFNSMRWLTSCWSCSVATPFDSPIWLALDWKLYGLSYSKSGHALSAPRATCGFISLRAGREAISSWKFGESSTNFPSLQPVNRRSLQVHRQPRTRQSQRADARVFFQNAFSLSLNHQTANVYSRGFTTCKSYLQIESDE